MLWGEFGACVCVRCYAQQALMTGAAWHRRWYSPMLVRCDALGILKVQQLLQPGPKGLPWAMWSTSRVSFVMLNGWL